MAYPSPNKIRKKYSIITYPQLFHPVLEGIFFYGFLSLKKL